MLRLSMLGIIIATLTACSAEPTGVPIETGGPSFAKAGGSTPASIAVAGDIAPLTTASGATVVAPVNQKAPFKNLTLTDVQVTLNAPTAPEAACKLEGSTRTYSDSFGSNAGIWRGDLAVWQGRTTQQSNFKFNGTRTVDGVEETVQFTANDEDAAQTTSGSTVTLTFTSARFGFGSESTHHDVDAAGMPIVRCVQLTMTASW